MSRWFRKPFGPVLACIIVLSLLADQAQAIPPREGKPSQADPEAIAGHRVAARSETQSAAPCEGSRWERTRSVGYKKHGQKVGGLALKIVWCERRGRVWPIDWVVARGANQDAGWHVYRNVEHFERQDERKRYYRHYIRVRIYRGTSYSQRLAAADLWLNLTAYNQGRFAFTKDAEQWPLPSSEREPGTSRLVTSVQTTNRASCSKQEARDVTGTNQGRRILAQHMQRFNRMISGSARTTTRGSGNLVRYREMRLYRCATSVSPIVVWAPKDVRSFEAYVTVGDDGGKTYALSAQSRASTARLASKATCPSAYADAVTVRSFRCRSETLLSLGDDDDPLRTIIRLNALQLFDGKRAKPVWVMANKSWCQPNGSRSIKLCKVRVRLGSGSHPAHQRIHHAPNEHVESKCKDYTVNASVSGKPFGVGVDVGVGAPVRRCETWDPRWRSPKGDVAVTWTGKVKGTRAVVILSMVSFTGVGNPGRFDGLIAHKVGR